MATTRLRVRWASVAVIGLAVAAGLTVIAVGSALGSAVYGIAVPLSLLFFGLSGIAIPLALGFPSAAMALAAVGVLAATAVAESTPTAPWPVAATSTVALCITLTLAGGRAAWPVGMIGWAVSIVGVLIITAMKNPGEVTAGAIVADLTVFAAVSLLALCTGILARSWRTSRQLLVIERQVSATEAGRREIVEERNRIARELHDIVAHGMSAIQVRAASARYRLTDLPEPAAAEFDELAATARSAMGEMRRLLDVLRDDRADTAPQPGLRELRELLAKPPHGGTLTVSDTLGSAEAGPVAELTIYRIVQESLSNVARHAPGAAVHVTLDRTPTGSVRIEVRNEASANGLPGAPVAVADRGGHGILGMKERAALLGGDLRAAALPDGGFAVTARIPTAQEET